MGSTAVAPGRTRPGRALPAAPGLARCPCLVEVLGSPKPPLLLSWIFVGAAQLEPRLPRLGAAGGCGVAPRCHGRSLPCS